MTWRAYMSMSESQPHSVAAFWTDSRQEPWFFWSQALRVAELGFQQFEPSETYSKCLSYVTVCSLDATRIYDVINDFCCPCPPNPYEFPLAETATRLAETGLEAFGLAISASEICQTFQVFLSALQGGLGLGQARSSLVSPNGTVLSVSSLLVAWGS